MEQMAVFSQIIKKANSAIELIQLFEPTALQYHPDGYYLTFSGGKDSVVIYALAKMAGVKFKAHYHLTTVDPPELVYFIRQHYPDVVIDPPEITMWDLIVKKQFPPTRTVRYCCDILKERRGTGCFTITGVRWEESRKRAQRQSIEILGTSQDKRQEIYLNCDNDELRRQVESCALKGKRVLNPIISWSTEDVWRFINKYRVPYCELYDQGFARLGCIGCPMASVRCRIMEFQRYPTYKRAYIRTFDRMIRAKEQSGKSYKTWKTGEDVFRWWMQEPAEKEHQIEGQISLDEYIDMAA